MGVVPRTCSPVHMFILVSMQHAAWRSRSLTDFFQAVDVEIPMQGYLISEDQAAEGV